MKFRIEQWTCSKNDHHVKQIFRPFLSLVAILAFVAVTGCNSDSENFVLTHQGQFIDGPVRGLDYLSGGQSGMTDEDGMFTFERGNEITFRLGSIQIGETVPVVTGLDEGENIPDIWTFTPRQLVPDAESNRDLTVTNILRFLSTLDNDYDYYDGVDNADNGIFITDAVRNNAASMNLGLDFTQDQTAFETAAEEVIRSLTGEYRQLIPVLTAQHHFMTQLLKEKVDVALNKYNAPGVTLSLESPCPCDIFDTECIESGEISGYVRYDSEAHAYIWDFVGGYADVEAQRLMTIDTRFRIHSITKSVVAMTLLKLVEEGLLDYNDLVQDHLPEPLKTTFLEMFDVPYPEIPQLPTYANAMTIANVMNHSAGLVNFYHIPSDWFLDLLFEPKKQWDLMSLVEEEVAKGPAFYPEQGWGYSNTGYALLGLVIEEVTGQPWEDVVKEKILDPYGLSNAFVPLTGEAHILGKYNEESGEYSYQNDPAPTNDYAYGYLNLWGVTGGIYGEEEDPMEKRDVQEPSFMASSGNMIGTTPFLRQWIKLIANVGTEDGLFGADFDWLHNSEHYNTLFFNLYDYLSVGANVYHNTTNQWYIISGNSTGYDVNCTYDIVNQVAAAGSANRTFDSTAVTETSGTDIWDVGTYESLQIKDVLVFDALDVLTR